MVAHVDTTVPTLVFDDYVLTSPQFHVRDVMVPATQASDHRPVIASLEPVPGATPR